MRLYHFTSHIHLSLIEKAGFLKLTESNLDAYKPHSGPDACFFFSTPLPPSGYNALYAKSEVRITVDVPRKWTRHWLSWARQRGIDETWLNALALAAGGIEMYENEYITIFPVPRARWTNVDVLVNQK